MNTGVAGDKYRKPSRYLTKELRHEVIKIKSPKVAESRIQKLHYGESVFNEGLNPEYSISYAESVNIDANCITTRVSVHEPKRSPR